MFAAIEQDFSFVVDAGGFGLDNAFIINDFTEHIASAFRRHQHMAAIRLNAAGVQHMGVSQFPCGFEIQFFRRIYGKIQIFGRRKGNLAALTSNAARVLHHRCMQSY